MSLNQIIILFIVLPILELMVLFELHQATGMLTTIILIFLTGIIGAYLVREQGLSILFNIRKELSNGHIPTKEMINGIMVLIAGAVLVTPGLITDAIGFSLLIPAIRNIIRKWLRFRFEKHVNNNYVRMEFR